MLPLLVTICNLRSWFVSQYDVMSLKRHFYQGERNDMNLMKITLTGKILIMPL